MAIQLDVQDADDGFDVEVTGGSARRSTEEIQDILGSTLVDHFTYDDPNGEITLDTSITPTWTGDHTFDAGLTIGSGQIDSSSGPIGVGAALDLDAINEPAHTPGQLFYHNKQDTLAFHNDRTAVTLNVGEEMLTRVYNDTGSQIPNGTAVYISGTHGNSGRPTIAPAVANDDTKSDVLGLATEDIPASSEGYVTSYGLVRGVDTSAFSAGDYLWLDPANAGEFTNVEPDAPNFAVRVGTVAKANTNNGQILVSPGSLRPQVYTEGGVTFSDSEGRAIEDAENFYWDDTNERLGIGTNSPQSALDIASGDLQFGAGGEILDDAGNTAMQFNSGGPVEFPNTEIKLSDALNLDPISEPSAPASGKKVYVDSADGALKTKDQDGTVTQLAA